MNILTKLLSILLFSSTAVLGDFHDEVEPDQVVKHELSENGYFNKYRL